MPTTAPHLVPPQPLLAMPPYAYLGPTPLYTDMFTVEGFVAGVTLVFSQVLMVSHVYF